MEVRRQFSEVHEEMILGGGFFCNVDKVSGTFLTRNGSRMCLQSNRLSQVELRLNLGLPL